MASVGFHFKAEDLAAQRVAASQAAKAVTEVTLETQRAIRMLIVESIRDGIPPYEAARRIRGMVGMTTRQAAAAVNFRRGLVDLGLTSARVELQMERYIAKKIRERSVNIARTEIMTALNRGVAQSWVQARNEGLLTTKQVAEIIITPDDRLCPICEPLDGVQVPIDAFSEHPPYHNMCRCTIGISNIREFKGVKGTKGATPQDPFRGLTDDEILKLPPSAYPQVQPDIIGKAFTRNSFQTFSVDGAFTAERSALHDAIVRVHFRGKTPVPKPKTTMLGGGPASGKSTAARAAKISKNTVTVDTDAVRVMLPEWKIGPRAKNAPWNHDEASAIGKRIINKATGKYDVLVDGTGDSSLSALTKKMQGYRARGTTEISGHYVSIDTEEAVRRMVARGKKSGRFVPKKYMRDVHASISEIMPDAIKNGLFDDLVIWDNNGKAPFIMARVKGKVLTILDEKAWTRFLSKARTPKPAAVPKPSVPKFTKPPVDTGLNGGLGVKPGQKDFWVPKDGFKSTSIDDVASSIRAEKVERAAAWDKDGNFLGSFSQNKVSNVAPPQSVEIRNRGGKFLHNHPSATSFSRGDTQNAAWDALTESRVVGVLDGKPVTYTQRGFDKLSTRGKLTKDGVSEAEDLGQRVAERMTVIRNEADSIIGNEYMWGKFGDDATQDFAQALHSHLTNLRIAEEFGFKYRAVWHGRIGSLNRFGTLDDALRLIGDKAKLGFRSAIEAQAKKAADVVRKIAEVKVKAAAQKKAVEALAKAKQAKIDKVAAELRAFRAKQAKEKAESIAKAKAEAAARELARKQAELAKKVAEKKAKGLAAKEAFAKEVIAKQEAKLAAEKASKTAAKEARRARRAAEDKLKEDTGKALRELAEEMSLAPGADLTIAIEAAQDFASLQITLLRKSADVALQAARKVGLEKLKQVVVQRAKIKLAAEATAKRRAAAAKKPKAKPGAGAAARAKEPGVSPRSIGADDFTRATTASESKASHDFLLRGGFDNINDDRVRNAAKSAIERDIAKRLAKTATREELVGFMEAHIQPSERWIWDAHNPFRSVSNYDSLLAPTAVEVGEMEALSRAVARDLVSRWAGTSGDSKPMSIAMQLAAKAEFKIAKASMKHIPLQTTDDAATILKGRVSSGAGDFVSPAWDPAESLLRKFLRAQYDNTQAMFAEEGITHVTVYRGAGLPFDLTAGAVDQTLNFAPMSSFSSSFSEAMAFAEGAGEGARGVMIAVRIPVHQIIGSARSGYGCLNELEYVLLGGNHEVSWLSLRKAKGFVSTEVGVATGMRSREEMVRLLFGLSDDVLGRETARKILSAGGG